VELAKDGNQFQFRRFIETGMADIHGRLERSNYLKSLGAMEFSAAAGRIIGDLNYVHPFREGNGRAQLQYLRLLATDAGHPVDLAKIDAARWLAASKAAHSGNYEPFVGEILAILKP
jgi:cell filamentation protein